MSIGKTTGISKSMEADGAIAANTIVKFGSSDDKVAQAVSATADCLVGIVEEAAASGERVSVQLTGVAEVKCGAAVARGDLLTADASGEAIETTTAKNFLIGIACISGADGDIIPVLLSQSAL